ncbi:MAG: winged helix-turn-helix domain-containing protein [Candidatus Nitrosocaldaceae archaeon]
MEYTLEEVRRKIINALREEEAGLSGVELAKKTGINRITLIKYLKLLESMSIVKRKRIGIGNIWYIDQTTADVLNIHDILDVKRYYIDAIINHRDIKNILNNSLQITEPIKLLLEVIIPSINTISELYNKGNISASEHMAINSIILESIILIKLNSPRNNLKRGATCILLDTASNNMSKILDAIFYIYGWNTYFIGSQYKIDPLFDIELMRFINKIWREDELILIGVYADKIENIQVIKEIIDDIRGRMHAVYMFAYRVNKESSEYYLYTDDLYQLIKWSEALYIKSKR